jgi:hypothetical protein
MQTGKYIFGPGTITVPTDLAKILRESSCPDPAAFFQCCGSGMFIPDPGSRIPDPDFYPSRIPDPGSRISDPGSRIQKQQQKREVKKISCHTCLCSHKIVNYFSFEVLKKKIWANFQRIIELFTKKIVKKLLKIWSWDPGSGIRDPGSGIQKKPIPDPGSRIQGSKSTRSRIPDPDPQHCIFHTFYILIT